MHWSFLALSAVLVSVTACQKKNRSPEATNTFSGIWARQATMQIYRQHSKNQVLDIRGFCLRVESDPAFDLGRNGDLKLGALRVSSTGEVSRYDVDGDSLLSSNRRNTSAQDLATISRGTVDNAGNYRSRGMTSGSRVEAVFTLIAAPSVLTITSGPYYRERTRSYLLSSDVELADFVNAVRDCQLQGNRFRSKPTSENEDNGPSSHKSNSETQEDESLPELDLF